MEIRGRDKLIRLGLHANIKYALSKAPLLDVKLSVSVLVSVDGEFGGVRVVFAT